jgi:hypothetical protein
MCNCVKELPPKIIDQLQDREKGKAKLGTGRLLTTGLTFPKGNKESWYQTGQQLEYEYTPIKKDGSFGKQINKTIQLVHHFCPFCGEKYPE